ncbi:hypothetical protein [Cupriavidus sp. UME77]|uniref:hypothetical protein n=1 Tax=Cupriavidus sp. UME77 TaxID=1862321 RepID=UPI0016019B76|nr:hypothetical protein [Cupriavidus sp. UME77]
MTSRNRIFRFLALPICGGVTLPLPFIVYSMAKEGAFELGGALLFFLIGTVLAAVVGWPLLVLIEWRFSQYRFRYIIGGLVCALLAWIFLEGAFYTGAWEKIWTNPKFWHEWAPRRIVLFSSVGLGAGVLYSGIVAIINKKVSKQTENGEDIPQGHSLTNQELRLIALPVCGGISLVLMAPGVLMGHVPVSLVIFEFIKGAIFTMILGWPLLALLDSKLTRYRFRYIIGGLACTLLAWLLSEGAFFPDAWEKIWTNPTFWAELAPRRVVSFSLIGLGAGALYSGVVAIINKKMPE